MVAEQANQSALLSDSALLILEEGNSQVESTAEMRGDNFTDGAQTSGRFPDRWACVGPWSLLSFAWVDKIFRLGNTRTIQ